MSETKINGLRVLVPIVIAGVLAVGGSYTLGFTHKHSDYVTGEQWNQMCERLARIEVKLDLILEAHDIRMSDDPSVGDTMP
jgi:hypothetical protein